MCIYTSAFLKSFLGHINAKEKSVTFFKYESFKKLYSFNNSKSNLLVNLIMLPKERKGINQVKSYLKKKFMNMLTDVDFVLMTQNTDTRHFFVKKN